jgi:exodeoxyribonuclease VII large subunit
MAEASKIYTVSEVNLLIKGVLESSLPAALTVCGQITNFKRYASGHCYFSLKDPDSVLPSVMWAGRSRALKFEPENGLAVLAAGFIDVYVPHGRYQFIVERIIPAGIGALQLAFEQMAGKLRAEGLFDDAHKKPLPPYPQRIGILTSESGAAVHDIRNSIHSRWPCVRLFLFPVPVQGEEAAERIAAGLREVNRRNKELRLDILIVGRGGGSLEDLWAFNEESVARAIFDSKIPVISAVGHEVDTTIADLVADARASTPTKAGVIAVPDMQDVLRQLANMQGRLTANAKATVELAQQNLETILASSVFRKPLSVLFDAAQRLDETAAKLQNCSKELLAGLLERLRFFEAQLRRTEPHRLLGQQTLELGNLRNRVDAAAKEICYKAQIRLSVQAGRLAALNPKSVLHRGYSITTNKRTALLVKDLDDVRLADIIVTELAGEKKIESRVTKN